MSEAKMAKKPRELRDEAEQLMRDDLIGPLGGAEEELREPPVDQYLLGLLAPRFGLCRTASPVPRPKRAAADEQDEDPIAADQLPDDGLAGGGITFDSGEEGTVEDRPPAADQLVPSAFGLTFAVDADCVELSVDAAWGAYSRDVSEEKLERDGRPARVWRRRPCGGRVTIAVGRAGAIEPVIPDAQEPEAIVRGIVRERDGHKLVSLFLVNGQLSDGGRSVPRWLFQASLAVSATDGSAAFVRRQIDAIGLAPAIDQEEIAGLEMQYRSSIELAVGHGVGVQVTEAEGRPGHGTRLETAVMPCEDVPLTEAPGSEDFTDETIRAPFVAALAALDMQRLSEASDAELPGLLTPLADSYEAWIATQGLRIVDPAARLEDYAKHAQRHLGTRA